VAQVHRSPGFITSNLTGKRADGVLIKEFEASHGTVADLWEAHLRGEETSLNPLGMVEALIGAMQVLRPLARLSRVYTRSAPPAWLERKSVTLPRILVTKGGSEFEA
jgi:isocitrate dehydrogenase